MLNFSSVLLGSHEPEKLVKFYTKVFERDPDWQDGGWAGWQVGDMTLTIGEHSEVMGKAKEPQRIILNLETDEVKEEFERIKNLGADVIAEPYEMEDTWIATLADPDGNYFQLMTPWEMDSKEVVEAD